MGLVWLAKRPYGIAHMCLIFRRLIWIHLPTIANCFKIQYWYGWYIWVTKNEIVSYFQKWEGPLWNWNLCSVIGPFSSFALPQSAAAAKRAFISPIYFNTPFFSLLLSSQAAADCYITLRLRSTECSESPKKVFATGCVILRKFTHPTTSFFRGLCSNSGLIHTTFNIKWSLTLKNQVLIGII